MMFELNGRTYFTETEIVERTWIREKRKNGQVMTCVFTSLPHNATEKEIMEYVISKGAKLVRKTREVIKNIDNAVGD